MGVVVSFVTTVLIVVISCVFIVVSEQGTFDGFPSLLSPLWPFSPLHLPLLFVFILFLYFVFLWFYCFYIRGIGVDLDIKRLFVERHFDLSSLLLPSPPVSHSTLFGSYSYNSQLYNLYYCSYQ